MSELSSSVIPHSKTAKWVHWGFIGVFIFALTKQLDEVDELEDFSLLQYEMTFATVFLVLVIARFFYMRSTRPTALPESTPRNMKLMARAAHVGMYVSLSIIALSGLCIGGLYWSGTKSGLVMDVVLVVHELAVIATYWLIAIHIAAAVYHRRKGDGIWDAMVPFWREEQQQTGREQ